MKNFKLQLSMLSICLAMGTSAFAQTLSKADFSAEKVKIAAEYKTAKAKCDSLSGNAKDICVATAKGAQSTSLADLDEKYEPSAKAHYKALNAKAEAGYAVAKEKCGALAGNAKDVCLKEAKAVEVAAGADAAAQLSIAQTNATASQKTSAVRANASAENAEARSAATLKKQDAEYKVEQEKCDKFAGDAKDNCVKQAKARYGK